jgi:hypothetical protein
MLIVFLKTSFSLFTRGGQVRAGARKKLNREARHGE